MTTGIPPDFADFRALSAMLGQNPLFVQGAGGNTSIKQDGVMWIKASGAWLKDASTRNIFVAIDHANALMLLDHAAEPVWRRLDADTALQPSIETSLHAVLPQRVVAHIHAVSVLALSVRRDAAEQFNDIFSNLRYAFVPYVQPGLPLTRALRRAMQASVSDIFVLGNHGLILGGEDCEEVISRLGSILRCLKSEVRTAPPPDMAFLESVTAKGQWRLPKEKYVHRLATDPISRAYAAGGSLYPDHVVFLGRGCRVFSAEELKFVDPARQTMVIVADKGVLLSANLPSTAEAMAECLAAVLSRIPPGVGLNYLTAREEDELLAWDAEKFRQSAN